MPFSKSRLYITKDIYNPLAWFIRTDHEKVARLVVTKYGYIDIWFYIYKIRKETASVQDALDLIEKIFVRYYNEVYFRK